MLKLQQLFEGHSVTLSYAWHLASREKALPLKKYNASSQSLGLYRDNAAEPGNPVSLRRDRNSLSTQLFSGLDHTMGLSQLEMCADSISLSHASFE